jgi:hypothetical protein
MLSVGALIMAATLTARNRRMDCRIKSGNDEGV